MVGRRMRGERGSGFGVILMLLLLLCTEARLPKHIPRFAFDREESPVNIPLIVNVLLVNLGPDAQPPSFRLDTDQFERLLFQMKPDHQPSCVETGAKLHVQYEIYYDVVHVSKSDSTALADTLKRSMRASGQVQHGDTLTGGALPSGGGEKRGFVPVYEVPVQGEVQEKLDKLYETYRDIKQYGVDMPADGKGKYGLILLNMDKGEMAPPHVEEEVKKANKDKDGSSSPPLDPALSYAYRYTHGAGSGSDSFVGSDRYAVVDLSAGPSTFGNTQQGEGTVIGTSIPRRHYRQWHAEEGEGKQLPSLLRSRSLKFQTKLASIVFSAVAHVFAPDIQFDELDFSERVLVPLVVFQDHQLFHPFQPGHPYSIDVEAIRNELQRMAMPGQVVEVVTGVQDLMEHERIAIALNKAERSDTVHESHKGRYQVRAKHYLDSKVLFQELAQTSDYLASGLIAASPVLSKQFFPDFENGGDLAKRKKDSLWALGTRVLPVFLFSLQQPGDPILLDASQTYAASKDAVLVVQSGHDDVTLPFFSGGKQTQGSLKDATAAILAGLAASFGGLMPPHVRYSQLHKKTVTDFLWAHGSSPFGPFANATSLSRIAVDQALANSYASRMDAAIDRVAHALLQMDDFAGSYLFDPLGEGMENAKPLGWLERLKRQEAGEHGAGPLSYATVRGLHDEVLGLEDVMSQGAEAMFRMDAEQTHSLSDVIFARASAFHSLAIKSLSAAHRALDCCSVQHTVLPRTRYSFYAQALLLGLIAACLVALVAFLNPTGPVARKKPVVH